MPDSPPPSAGVSLPRPADESVAAAEERFSGGDLGQEVTAHWRGRQLTVAVLVAAFVLSPAVSTLSKQGFTGKATFLIPAAAVFAIAMGLLISMRDGRLQGWRRTAWLAGTVPLGLAVFAVGGEDWTAALAIAATAFGSALLSARATTIGVACCSAFGLAFAPARHLDYGDTLVVAAVPALTGMLAYTGARRSLLVSRLHEARAELARMAVARERLRIARDLHDLLGHSLSLIALKAELAGRLVSADAERAGKEISELESVARRSLGEVRQAVAGYRQPVLIDELAAAKRILTAAGVSCQIETPDGLSLPPAADALLAWTVREGTTNVVRHAGARWVTITISLEGESAAVRLTDDGVGPPPAPGAGPAGVAGTGSGLAGLAERAARFGGSMSAGPGEAGAGFTLAVTVPRAAAARPPAAGVTGGEREQEHQ